MPGSVEQFVIVVLGGFTIMMAITLALQPWFSWAQVTPIFISLLSFMVSVVALYFTYFWHPSDFVVYLRFPEPRQLGTTTINVNYFLSNMGNQTVFVEDVAVVELWIKSDRPEAVVTLVGKNGQIEWMDESYMCNDANIYFKTATDILNVFSSPFPSSLNEQKHVPVMRVTTLDHQPLEGLGFALVKPTRKYIEHVEAKAAATTVEAGKMKEIAATFDTESLPLAKYNVVVVCPVIRIFDSKSQPVLAVCRGERASHLDHPDPVLGDTLFSVLPGVARLLPVASRSDCRRGMFSSGAS